MANLPICSLALLVLAQSAFVLCRPQPQEPNIQAPTTTTASPEFTRCMSECQTVYRYNPVCGTNRQTYPNEGQLNCARNCGLNVQLDHLGTCGAFVGWK